MLWKMNLFSDRYLIDIPGVTPEALRGTISSILAHELGNLFALLLAKYCMLNITWYIHNKETIKPFLVLMMVWQDKKTVTINIMMVN